MLIKIGKYEFTEVWDGILYKNLPMYPQISDWEIRTLIEFIEYENKYGRECDIECENDDLREYISQKIKERETYLKTPRPHLLTECTACPYRKGCVTEYVCHTAPVENAKMILRSGKLLSALNARKVPVEVLMAEKRNAANDPADYFQYVMFNWGNCQAGDRLVMERQLGRSPDDDDLSIRFDPGIRFYFEYETLIKHPRAVCDGVLPMKVKDEVILSDWVYRIVVPLDHKEELSPYIPDELKEKVLYINNDCNDIWDWSEKVYRTVEQCD